MMKSILLLFAVSLVLIACKKENTVWNSDWSTPLINDTLSLVNLVNDSTLSEDAGYYHLNLNRTLFDLDINQLVKIPDTTISESFTIVFISFNAPPGYTFANNIEEHTVNIPDVQLKEITLKQGFIDVIVKNPIGTTTIFDVTLPGVTKDGQTFSETYSAPPGTMANPGITTETIDLSGYNLDLTGLSGNGSNTLRSQITIKTDPNGPSVLMTNQDSSKVNATFRGVEIYYARGYFGNQLLTDTVSYNIEQLNSYVSGMIDLPNTSLIFEVENGIKVPAEGNIKYATNTNALGSTVSLSSTQLNNIYSISSATGNWSSLTPSTKQIEFNSTNSNIEQYIENLGADHEVAYKFQLNPWGNVSGSYNELFPNSIFRVKVKADMPLKFAADQLTLRDTFDLNLNQDPEKTRVVEGTLILDVNNAFPISLETKLRFLGANDNLLYVVNGVGKIESGEFGTVDPANGLKVKSSSIEYLLPADMVENITSIKKVVIEAKVNTVNPTSGMVEQMPIPVNAFLKILLRSNFKTENVY